MGLLDGNTAIVTGSARGIGRAIVELLVEQGASVVINDIDRDAAELTAAEIDGPTAVCAGDITADGTPDVLVSTALTTFGGLDIIVNNAGYTLDAPIHKMSDGDFQAMLDIHAVAPFRLIRAAAPHLRETAKQERAQGREVFRKVVNVSSVAGTMGNPGQANYSVAKSGVLGLTKTLAKEWGAFKVNVNAVAFGFVDTRMTVVKTADSRIAVGARDVPVGIPAEQRAAIPSIIPLGRAASPREAAGGVLFLCSPWSNYVHGQVLNVTGGMTFGMDS